MNGYEDTMCEKHFTPHEDLVNEIMPMVCDIRDTLCLDCKGSKCPYPARDIVLGRAINIATKAIAYTEAKYKNMVEITPEEATELIALLQNEMDWSTCSEFAMPMINKLKPIAERD